MPIRDYPFLEVTKEGGIALKTSTSRPMVWVRVFNPHNGAACILLGHIDTGADECTAPADLAAQLGHDLNKGTKKRINTASGPGYAYAHTTHIEILDVLPDGYPDVNKVLFTIRDTLIDFAEGLPVLLLGRERFLDRFNLSIRYPQRTLSIHTPTIRSKKRTKKSLR